MQGLIMVSTPPRKARIRRSMAFMGVLLRTLRCQVYITRTVISWWNRRSGCLLSLYSRNFTMKQRLPVGGNTLRIGFLAAFAACILSAATPPNSLPNPAVDESTAGKQPETVVLA